MIDLIAAHAIEGIELHDFEIGGGAIFTDIGQRIADPNAAAPDGSDADTADEIIVIEQSALPLERAIRVAFRRGNLRQNHIEKRGHARLLSGRIRRKRRGAVQGGHVDDREIEKIIRGAELDEEIEDFVDGFLRIGIRPVNLVDDHDRLDVVLEGVLQDETGLWHRAFIGVDHQKAAIHHVHDPLDFAAEIGVPRSIDDVDFRILPFDGSGLGQNGDAPFVFDRVRVHHAVLNFFVLTKSAGIGEQSVDEGGFSMVDVRDDCNVSNVHKCLPPMRKTLKILVLRVSARKKKRISLFRNGLHSRS